MRYVERKNGEVVAHYSHPNAVATEALPEDHPDIKRFQAKRIASLTQPSKVDLLERRVTELEAEVAKLKSFRVV